MLGKALALAAFVGATVAWPLYNGFGPAAPTSLLITMAAPSATKAFPEAVGPGASALTAARDSVINGSWPLRVWKITNLNNTGNGSLRAVFEDSIQDNAYNIIIPTVGGRISCSGEIDPRSGGAYPGNAVWNVYYAGQASPGGGIDITGCRFNFPNSLRDWVIRYLRVSRPPPPSSGNISFMFHGFERLYLDHLTGRWAANLLLSLGVDTAFTDCGSTICPGQDVTIANSLWYDSHYNNTPICLIAGGQPEDNTPLFGVLFYRNFMMNCSHRAPAHGGDSTYIHNNITYNIRRDGGYSEQHYQVDYSGNYRKNGAWTETGDGNSGSWMYLAGPESGIGPKVIFSSGLNRHWRNNMDPTTPVDSAWRGGKRIFAIWRTVSGHTEGDTVPLAWKGSGSLKMRGVPWAIDTPNAAWVQGMVDSVGVSMHVTAAGYWSMDAGASKVRDSYDSTRLKQFVDSVSVHLGSGFDADTVTYPTIASGTAYADTDGDGLPDEFELACVGNKFTMAPDGDNDGDGYLNIEQWVNGMNGIRDLAWDDNSVDEDGFRIYVDRGAGFVILATVGANVTSYRDTQSQIGYRYQVLAFRGGSDSSPSNTITSDCN